MSNFTATTKLMQVSSERESLLSLRNLKIKTRLQKDREGLNKAFKDKADRQQGRRQTGANALLGLAGGGAGLGIMRRFRPRRPSPTTGGKSGLRKFNIFRTKPSISGGGRVNTNIIKGGSKLNSLLTVAFTGYDFLDRKSSGQTNVQAGTGALGTTGGAIAGGAAGAKFGALVGSFIVPGAGTVVGGALGGILGSFIGATTGGNIADSITGANEETRRKLELKKVDLQKRSTLFGSALDKFDIVLDKFEKLRQDDFDPSMRRQRDFGIPARQGGLGGFIRRFAGRISGKPSGDTTAETPNEFDVTNLEQKPRNFKEQLQREKFILKKIIQNSPRIFKESVDQTIKEYIDAFTDPTNILVNLLLMKFAGGRGVGKVKIPRNMINVTPGSIKNPFPNLGGSRVVIPNTSSGTVVKPTNIPFFTKPQFLNRNVTKNIQITRQVRRIEFKTNKILADNRRLVRRVNNKNLTVNKKAEVYFTAIRNLKRFGKEMAAEGAQYKDNKILNNAYMKVQKRIMSQVERYRTKETDLRLQEVDRLMEIQKQASENIEGSDIELLRNDLVKNNMFRKIINNDYLNPDEQKLYNSYRDFLKEEVKAGRMKDTDIIEFFNRTGGGEELIELPKGYKVNKKKMFPGSTNFNFKKFEGSTQFKKIKKFIEESDVPISFNTIQQGNDTTNIAIDDSNTLAMFGGGSSINMIELNGYMSV